jgi:hypothetical protein
MKKNNLDTSKPKKRQRKKHGSGQAELREAIRRAHERIVGAEPFFARRFNYGKTNPK